MLTTVAALKVDVSQGRAEASMPGPGVSLKSCFRNAKKLLYFLAEIMAFQFKLGRNRRKVFLCVMLGSVSLGAALCPLQAYPTPAAREYLTWWFYACK